jgi:hypothetical protein
MSIANQNVRMGGLLCALTSISLITLSLMSLAAKKDRRRSLEATRDKTLKDSFPASDPPASNYFDIPTNRQ